MRFIRLSAASLLRTVRSFPSADDKIMELHWSEIYVVCYVRNFLNLFKQ